MRLWADIPAAERMTEFDLASCRGAQEPGWLEGNVAILRSPRCPAAAKWVSWGKYLPCRQPPSGADGFCSFHVSAEVRAQRREEHLAAVEREVDEAVRRLRDRKRALIRRTRAVGAASILLGAAERLIARAERVANRPSDWWVGAPPADYDVDSGQIAAALRDEYGPVADEVVRRWFGPSHYDRATDYEEDEAWREMEKEMKS